MEPPVKSVTMVVANIIGLENSRHRCPFSGGVGSSISCEKAPESCGLDSGLEPTPESYGRVPLHPAVSHRQNFLIPRRLGCPPRSATVRPVPPKQRFDPTCGLYRIALWRPCKASPLRSQLKYSRQSRIAVWRGYSPSPQ